MIKVTKQIFFGVIYKNNMDAIVSIKEGKYPYTTFFLLRNGEKIGLVQDNLINGLLSSEYFFEKKLAPLIDDYISQNANVTAINNGNPQQDVLF